MALRRESRLPMWSGLSSMFRLPRRRLEELREAMVAIVGVPYDYSSTGRWGSRLGPEKIREMSLIWGIFEDIGHEVADVATGQLLKMPTQNDLADLGDLNVYPSDWSATENSLREAIAEILARRALPVVLGGDHFVTYPLVLGFGDAVKAEGHTPAYLQLSRYLDLGVQDPLWGSVWRGATAKRILDFGSIDQQDMIWIGVHGYIPTDQWQLAQEKHLKILTLRELRRVGIKESLSRILEPVTAGRSLYVSVSIDILDGVYGTAADRISFDGLTPVELQDMCNLLMHYNVGAWDFVGVNPLVNPTPYPRNCEHLISTIIMNLVMSRIASRVTTRD